MSRWSLLIFRSVGQKTRPYTSRSSLLFICWGKRALLFYKHLYFFFIKWPRSVARTWLTQRRSMWRQTSRWCRCCSVKGATPSHLPPPMISTTPAPRTTAGTPQRAVCLRYNYYKYYIPLLATTRNIHYSGTADYVQRGPHSGLCV